MSTSYVFLMSRKKTNGQDQGGFTLNPAERNRDFIPQRSQSFGNSAYGSSSLNQRPNRQPIIIDNAGRNRITSPDNFSNTSSVRNYPNPNNQSNSVNPRLRPVSASRIGSENPNNWNDTRAPSYEQARRYNRRTAPSHSYDPSLGHSDSQTLPARRLSRGNADDRPHSSALPQPIEVKAKTWSRLSNNNLASVCDSSSNLSIPSMMQGVERTGSRTRLNTQSYNDLRLRSGSRTEINVPIQQNSRRREYSTSTTELAMKISSLKTHRTVTENYAADEQRNRTRPKFSSTTDLQLRNRRLIEELHNADSNDRRSSYGPVFTNNASVTDLRGNSVSYNTRTKLAATESGLEAALEKAKQKVDAGDQRKTSSAVIQLKASNNGMAQVNSQPSPAAPFDSNPRPNLPFSDNPGQSFQPEPNQMQQRQFSSVTEVPQNGGMKKYKTVHNLKPQISFKEPETTLQTTSSSFSQSASSAWSRPNQSQSSIRTANISQSESFNQPLSRQQRSYVIGNDRNDHQWTSLERQQSYSSSTVRSSTERRISSNLRSSGQEHSSDSPSRQISSGFRGYGISGRQSLSYNG
ncbi:uncharacterized protein LOC142340945 isoform X2 [Convolutriloba macropyga]|uniref:uncharacterized protein LOC142340945 isoform X2 n=1 Tax=Convolutriloba macropyga TaxID=536237 RepID=UPI003F51E721